MTDLRPPPARPALRFPLGVGVLLGLGLGGFFDGIVFHQLLQWHHMATSAGYPPDSIENLRLNTLLDGLFHAATYAMVVVGVWLGWRAAREDGVEGWRGRDAIAALLIGFGAFNLVEGLVNHHLLGLHHVNESAPRGQWVWWDIGFLLWGAAMLAAGYALWVRGRA